MFWYYLEHVCFGAASGGLRLSFAHFPKNSRSRPEADNNQTITRSGQNPFFSRSLRLHSVKFRTNQLYRHGMQDQTVRNNYYKWLVNSGY